MFVLAALAMLVSAAHAPLSVSVDATNKIIAAGSYPLAVHTSGRTIATGVDGKRSRGAKRYVHQWPAVYWEAAFVGDQLMLKFDDDKNEYRLTVDEARPATLAQPGQSEVMISGLGPGEHRVRLDKVTESVDFSRAFEGFFVRSPKFALPAPPPRSRQIEFIGDSGMTGYGIHSRSRTCTKEEVRLRTDSGAAWPSIVARHFNADYQINAMSGRGLVRNYDGVEPQRTMSVLYPRALPDGDAVWRNPAWHPQVFVVLLFVDFVTDVKPGEPWHDQRALVADYTNAYEKLIVRLQQRSPSASIVLPWLDFTAYHDEAAQELSSTVQSAIRAKTAAIGMPDVQFPVLSTSGMENTACDYHWSVDDHRRMAEWMIAWLSAHPDAWGRR